MTKYVNPNYIKYELSKIRKSSNFNYARQVRRNKLGLIRTSPLANLMEYLNTHRFSEEEKGNIVVEYWERVAKDPNMEKEIAKEFKIKYDKKYKDNI